MFRLTWALINVFFEVKLQKCTKVLNFGRCIPTKKKELRLPRHKLFQDFKMHPVLCGHSPGLAGPDSHPFQPLVPPLKHLTKDHFLRTSVCFHHSNSHCLTPCGHLLHSTPTEPHVTASVRTICRTHSHIHYRR
jgi:hypothetical protein